MSSHYPRKKKKEERKKDRAQRHEVDMTFLGPKRSKKSLAYIGEAFQK